MLVVTLLEVSLFGKNPESRVFLAIKVPQSQFDRVFGLSRG